MTTMAAMLGGLPLALGGGTGAELRRPLGIAIVGGLIFSQALTLFTTPSCISRLIGWRSASATARPSKPQLTPPRIRCLVAQASACGGSFASQTATG